MNYKKIYDQLINSRRQRPKEEGAYYERHHILPLCFGGDNSSENLVNLTVREHFIAHKLLFRLSTGSDKQKLGFALNQMFRVNPYQQDRRKLSTRRAATLREVHRTLRGPNHPSFGRKVHSEESRKQISRRQTGSGNPMYGKKPWNFGKTKDTDPRILQAVETLSEGYLAGRNSRYRHPMTEANKLRVAQLFSGPKSIEHRKKLSAANKGQVHSPESIEKVASQLRGRKHPIVTCPHCGKSGGHSAMRRHHFDHCKTII